MKICVTDVTFDACKKAFVVLTQQFTVGTFETGAMGKCC
jgi:hypothetical protein